MAVFKVLSPTLCFFEQFCSFVPFYITYHFSKTDKIANFNQQLSLEVSNILEKYSVPGAAYVIVKGGKVSALETFGHTDKHKLKPIDSQTVFRLASVSKTFAATATTMLAQDNKLNLPDKITQDIPTFKLAQAGAANKIELKHLLSQPGNCYGYQNIAFSLLQSAKE